MQAAQAVVVEEGRTQTGSSRRDAARVASDARRAVVGSTRRHGHQPPLYTRLSGSVRTVTDAGRAAGARELCEQNCRLGAVVHAAKRGAQRIHARDPAVAEPDTDSCLLRHAQRPLDEPFSRSRRRDLALAETSGSPHPARAVRPRPVRRRARTHARVPTRHARVMGPGTHGGMERTRRSRRLQRVEPLGLSCLGLKRVVNMPIWFRMLRADNRAQLVKLPWTLSRMLSGRRYAVQSGRKITELRWSKAQMGSAQQAQAAEPDMCRVTAGGISGNSWIAYTGMTTAWTQKTSRRLSCSASAAWSRRCSQPEA